jgi:hypothetical protein
MARPGIGCRAALTLGLTAILAGPAIPQGKGAALSALGRLEPGLWQVRNLEERGSAPQAICVADPAILMQVQHRHSPCSRTVLANDAASATVHYTCPAHGFGRTSLRVETPRLAKIDTQGIVDNAPFAYRAEARRVGACGVPAAKGAR